MTTSDSWWRRQARAWWPLSPLVIYAVLLLGLLSLSRLALSLAWHDRLALVPGWWRTYTIGVRIDVVLLGFLLILPALTLLLLPPRWLVRFRTAFLIYGTATLTWVLFMELSTWQFMAEFERRPDALFWEYLKYPREVLTTIVKTGWPSLIVAAVLLPAAVWGLWRVLRSSWELGASHDWHWRSRVALLLLAVPIFIAIRGFDRRPINPSSACFCDENVVNQITLNSAYTALFALYARRNEADVGRIYGRMEDSAVIAAVRRSSGLPPQPLDANLPTLNSVATTRTPQPTAAPTATAAARPYNLVVLLQESLGADYVGCLGGLPLTPNIDQLAKEGLLLTKLHATGDRTVRGIEATLSGVLPSPSTSVVKLPLSQSNFFTAASLLRRHGYQTMFVYGGVSNFDNMRSFFQGNGFSRFIDEPLFSAPKFKGTWGVSDEDLMERAVEEFAAVGDKPFFGYVLSTSNHVPFEFPTESITLYEQPANTRNNAIKYADYAIGRFFAKARTKPFFANTIFVIVADHNVRTIGQGLAPVKSFRIPAVILGPGITPGTYDRLCSQIDLMPTLLPMLGMTVTSPLVGRNVLTWPSDQPGRTVMQSGDRHVWIVGDRVVIHLPESEPRCFRLSPSEDLIPVADTWPELVLEARAHALLPGLLYRTRRYTLPPESPAGAAR